LKFEFLNSCYTCREFNELVAQAVGVGMATIAGILQIVARPENKKSLQYDLVKFVETDITGV
jgi:hypothetical protein